MKRTLEITTGFGLYYYDAKGCRCIGRHSGLSGDISGLRGNVSGLRGDVTGLRGDASGLRGNVSGLRGDVTGLSGYEGDIKLYKVHKALKGFIRLSLCGNIANEKVPPTQDDNLVTCKLCQYYITERKKQKDGTSNKRN